MITSVEGGLFPFSAHFLHPLLVQPCHRGKRTYGSNKLLYINNSGAIHRDAIEETGTGLPLILREEKKKDAKESCS